MAIVYVLSKDGKPLMPTTRCGHVRWLLKVGQARVVERKPFAIQLEYETENVTQPFADGTKATPRNCANVLQNAGLVFV